MIVSMKTGSGAKVSRWSTDVHLPFPNESPHIKLITRILFLLHNWKYPKFYFAFTEEQKKKKIFFYYGFLLIIVSRR